MPQIIALSVRQIPTSLFQVLTARFGGASTDALKTCSQMRFAGRMQTTGNSDCEAIAGIS